MKNLTLIFLALVASFGTFAQQVTANSKVTAAFSQQELSSKSPQEIEYLNFLSEKLCDISDLGPKAESYPVFNLTDKNGNSYNPEEAFNPLMFPSLQAQSEYQYFRIAGTTRVILVQSTARLEILYQRYLANK